MHWPLETECYKTRAYKALFLSSFFASLLLYLVVSFGESQIGLTTDYVNPSVVGFEKTWHSLGPLRIGTREASWGVDPLATIGGFANVEYDQNFTFRSPLVPNATIKWTRHDLEVRNVDNEAMALLHIGYDHVDWAEQQHTHGWPALQYQAWIRGVLRNPTEHPRKVWIYSDVIIEFYVNDDHFFGGDFFSFNRAPVLVELRPGPNVVNVRLVRDARSMGGAVPPRVEAQMRIVFAKDRPEIDYNQVLTVPDIVEGKLPSRYFSIPIRNPLSDWIAISECERSDVKLIHSQRITPVRIAPGQVRPVGLVIAETWQISEHLAGDLCFSVENNAGDSHQMRLPFNIPLKRRTVMEASKFTFLHPGEAVSYAILKPPITQRKQGRVPLLVGLHGAGVEADSITLKQTFDGMPDLDAFVLFPTGMSPWSGDDWHLWGSDDVLRAIDAVHNWVDTMGWNGTYISTDRVVVAGHSNGGQGTWYFVTHFPDRVSAAVQASGWASIENYVPYTMWREAEAFQNYIIHNARGSFRHELLLGNSAHLHILQQQGSADDNVPPFQGRLMSTLRSELGGSSDYIEWPGKPHWWERVMTTKPLQDFYIQNLKDVEVSHSPATNFSVVAPGCGVIGSKFGITIDQLQSPDQYGHIDVELSEQNGRSHWHLVTRNIHRLHFDFERRSIERPFSLSIDSGPNTILASNVTPQDSYTVTSGRKWKSSKEEWKKLSQRSGRQRGALDSILGSRGVFRIVSCVASFDLAVQTSRNLFQYYGADSNIIPCDGYDPKSDEPGNVILLTTAPEVSDSQLESFPIRISGGNVHVRSSNGYEVVACNQVNTGAIFLRPLTDERLELIIWGSDYRHLGQAARLSPAVTGTGIPDFVVLGSGTSLRGYRSTLAMGFFDHNWNISSASYLA